jgi:hypothetical protein
VVEGAYAQRQPSPRPALPRLAAALAAATLVAALLLSPAGAAVRDWVDDVLTPGVRDAQRALTDLPGGGRLLVASPAGEWVVQPDGSRRLLGRYREATWSPHGLFVAAVSGHTLSALEPDGTVRWVVSAKAPLTDPRWSPSGFRIAYRAGRALRVVAGNARGDRLIDRRVAPVPPAWAPGGPHLLAYLDTAGELVVVNADTGQRLDTGAAPGIGQLAWAPDGSRLMQAARGSLWIREVSALKLSDRVDLGPPRRVSPPSRARVERAAFSPDAETIAALFTVPRRGGRPPRSELRLLDARGRTSQTLFRAPGELSGLAWSPRGERLLISWAEADQWLFIPVAGRGSVRAIGGISAQFAPGAARPAFPRLEGWCCPARR